MPVQLYKEVIPFIEHYFADKIAAKIDVTRVYRVDTIRVRFSDDAGNVFTEQSEDIDISYIPIGDTGTISVMLSVVTSPRCPSAEYTKVTDLAPGSNTFEGEDLHYYLIVVRGRPVPFTVRLLTSGASYSHVPRDIDGDGSGVIGILLRVRESEKVEVVLQDEQEGAVFDLGTSFTLFSTNIWLEVAEIPLHYDFRRAVSQQILCVTGLVPRAAVVVGIGMYDLKILIGTYRRPEFLHLLQGAESVTGSMYSLEVIEQPLEDIYIVRDTIDRVL